MQISLECYPCFLKQTVRALTQNSGDGAPQREIIGRVLDLIKSADTSRTPAHLTSHLHRIVREGLGHDPFSRVKREYNGVALQLLPELREKVRLSRDPLHTAARLAIAGNIIDFGIFSTFDIEGSIRRALDETIAADDYPYFRHAVSGADSVLYLLDNAGEIVFDMLLIEQLVSMKKEVKAVVKGAPVINDVTWEDALQTGLTDICEVMDNGSDAVGTILELTSPDFQEAFGRSDLIISKGQANFETVPVNDKKVFYLFQSKCDVVSRELGLETGAMLLKMA